MRRCPSCITALHAWMMILPIKSRAGQQSSCSQFLNERASSLAESLMPEQLLCQSDETCQTYFSELRRCCYPNKWAWLILGQTWTISNSIQVNVQNPSTIIDCRQWGLREVSSSGERQPWDHRIMLMNPADLQIHFFLHRYCHAVPWIRHCIIN